MSVNKEKTKKKAQELASKGKFDAAAKELERIVQENPSDIVTLNEIGDLYARGGKIKEAVKNFQAVAHHYSKEGFYAKAIAAYKKITKIDPKNKSVYFQLADLYIKEELHNDARECLILAAQNFMDDGEKDRAKEAYEKILKIQPESIKVRIKLAEIYEKDKAFEKAVNEYIFIGKALLEKNLDKEAQAVFEKVMKIQSGNIDAANNLVEIYTRTGNNQQAIILYNTMLKNDPDNIDIMKAYGRTLYNINEVKKAGKVVQRLLEKIPDDVESLSIMGKISLQENNIHDAFKFILQVINLKFKDGPDKTTIDLLKPLLEKDGYYLPALEKMHELYTTLSDINNTITSYEKLGVAYRHHKMYDKALQAYEKVLDFNPENKKAQVAIAELKKSMLDNIPRSEEQKELGEDIVAVGDIPIEIPLDMKVAPKEPEPRAPEKAPQVSPPQTAVSGEEISNEEIYEIEILIKYGLLDKAKGRLLDLTSKFPKHKEIRKLLKAIYQEKGDRVKSSIESMYLSEIYESENNKATAKKLKEEALDTLRDLHGMGVELPAEALAFIGVGAVAASPIDMLASAADVLDEVSTDGGGLEIVDINPIDFTQVETGGPVEIDDIPPENSIFTKPSFFEQSASTSVEDSISSQAAKSGPSIKDLDISFTEDEIQVEQIPKTAVKEPPPSFAEEQISGDKNIQFPVIDILEVMGVDSGSIQAPAPPSIPVSPRDDLLQGLEMEGFFSDKSEPSAAMGLGAEDTWNKKLNIDEIFSEKAAKEKGIPIYNPSAAAQPVIDQITDDEMVSIFGHQGEHIIEDQGDDLVSHIFGEKTITDARTLLFELEEVDFYIANEFFEEAKAKIKELQYKYPDHGGVKDRVKILAEKAAYSEIQKFHKDVFEAETQKPAFASSLTPNNIEKAFEDEISEFFGENNAPEAGIAKALEPIEKPVLLFSDKDLFEEEEQFFNITSEIESEFDLPEPTTNINLEAQLESIFDEFREEVNETLTEEDYETRYNLGIAYKEMGLVDEAIHEFQAAFKGSHFKVTAATMLGYCFLDKQRPPQAIQWFRMAVNNLSPLNGPEEILGIKLALAKSYVANGEKQNAVDILREISKINPYFPGLSELANQLR